MPEQLSSVILVVEDEDLLRAYAAFELEDAGFEVVEATSANDALGVLRTRPDLRVLFTDVQMPGKMDGLDLAHRVHQQWPNVLLLITSGNRRPRQGDIPDHGHFLQKPYRVQEVVKEINALAREAAAR